MADVSSFDPEVDLVPVDSPVRNRELYYKKIGSAFQNLQAASNDTHELRIEGVDFKVPDAKTFGRKALKKARISGDSLTFPVRGRYALYDKVTGAKLSETRPRVVMNVPWITEDGSMLRNGVAVAPLHQPRLMPNVYHRVSADGFPEAQFNPVPRSGSGFRMNLDPESGVFHLEDRSRKIPLYQVLKTLGVDDEVLNDAWGQGVLEENRKAKVSTRFHEWLQGTSELGAKFRIRKGEPDTPELHEDTKGNVTEYFGRIKFDPEGTRATLGRPHAHMSNDTFVDSSKKLLGIHRGIAEKDDRDSLQFQQIYDMGDVLADKLSHDQGNVLRDTLWNITGKWGGDVSKVPSGLLNKHLDTYFNGSGLVQSVDQVNPYEVMNHTQRLVRLGEGGISSMESVPREARNVIPSYLGFVDPIRGPESMKVGIDSFMARGVRKGPDGQLYQKFQDAKTGKDRWVGMREAAQSVIYIPEYDSKPEDKYIPAMFHGQQIFYVPREEVDFILKSGDDMFSPGGGSVPLKAGVKGKRFSMGSKYLSHALPIENREVPYVQDIASDGRSQAEYLGQFGGLVRSEAEGEVVKVSPDEIVVRTRFGDVSHELHDDYPMARKTRLFNIPQVKVGDRVMKDHLLATSNVTDTKGHMAIGRNLTVMFAPYLGMTFEDGVALSDEAAASMGAHMMYTFDHSPQGGSKADKLKYRTLFPGKFNDQQIDAIDDNGFVKPGTVLNYGDPMVLAHTHEKPAFSSMGAPRFNDNSMVWHHQSPGVVTAVEKNRDGGYTVAVKSNDAFRDGDKVALPFGNKGVTAKIVKKDLMPRTADGKTIDLVVNPLGLISRTNTAQVPAASLGKVAAKTGKPYIMPSFNKEDMAAFAQKEMAKHGVKEFEDIYDPILKMTLPNMFVGNLYTYRMQQTAEAGSHSRGTDSYTLDETPTRGGENGAKHIGDMELGALIASGAQSVIQDLKMVKGQANPDYWRDVRAGRIPQMPGESFVREKFRNMVRGAGINYTISPDGRHKLFAMTNDDLNVLAGDREIKTGETFDAKTLRPIPGGLFDPEATGSEAGGNRFAYMRSPEPLLNPMMEPVVRSLLGVTKNELNTIIRGDVEYEGKRGGEALKLLLSRLNVDGIATEARQMIRDGKVSKRDAAIKRLAFASALKRNDATLDAFMLDKIPVVPPKYRPIIEQGSRVMVSDLNYLYKKFDDARKDYDDAQQLDPETQKIARERLYHSFKAITGVEDPEDEKLQTKRIGGVLDLMLGKNSPKMGFAARKLIGADVDMTGLGVVIPDPDIRLDQIGVPESKLWDIYKNFTIRRMRLSGMPAEACLKAFKDQSDVARKALHEELRTRPMVLNRAPTLHRYSVSAQWPVPVEGESIRIPPALVEPFNMDFDGDKASYIVPATAKAVRSAIRNLTPMRNLISARNQKANYVPKQEFLMGLYTMSAAPTEGKAPRRYASDAAVIKAYESGELGPRDPVLVG